MRIESDGGCASCVHEVGITDALRLPVKILNAEPSFLRASATQVLGFKFLGFSVTARKLFFVSCSVC